MTITNTQKITEVTMKKIIHCFCPLGDDWYSAEVTMKFTPYKEYFDYCKVDDFILKTVEGKSLIIEDLVDILYQFCETAEPLAISVEARVSDAQHLPVIVKKERRINSV